MTVRLPRQSLQILRLLLTHSGDVVSRERLREELWSEGTFVDFERGLNSAINKLRRVLSDTAENPRYIQTVPGRGYRFIGTLDDFSAWPTVSDRESELGRQECGDSAEISPSMESSLLTERPTGNRLRKIWRVAAATLMLALFAAGEFYFHRRPKLTDTDKIVLADFQNRTGDRSLTRRSAKGWRLSFSSPLSLASSPTSVSGRRSF